VTGVLCGLVAENWVSGLRDRSQASDIQMRLVEDLRTDAYEAGRRATFYSRVASRSDSVLADLHGVERVDDPARFIVIAFDASRIYGLAPAHPTWDDLGATGRLGLLDPDLRLRLARYYRSRDGNAGTVSGLSADYRKRVRSLIPVALQNTMLDECSWFDTLDQNLDVPCELGLSNRDAEALAAALRGDSQLSLDLNWLLSEVTVAVRIFGGAASQANELASYIENR